MGIECQDAIFLGSELVPSGGGRREVDALPGTLPEFPAGHTDEPLILAALELDEFGRRGLGEVDARLLGLAMDYLEDAASATMDAVLIVAEEQREATGSRRHWPRAR